MLTLAPFPGLRFALTAPFQPSDAAVARPAPVPLTSLTLLQRLDRWLWRQEQRGREAFLARATDRFDLEQRMRQIDRAGALWFG